MLQAATPIDDRAIIALTVDTGMFHPDEVAPLQDALNSFHAGLLPEHQLQVWTETPGSRPLGVVYFGPDAMADRKWDLWMIAVAPDRQRSGIGSTLIRYAEAEVRAAGGRLLLIDTSSQPKYDPTRAFYARHGYTEVARIPDFYTDGDSKVIYSKRIAPVLQAES